VPSAVTHDAGREPAAAAVPAPVWGLAAILTFGAFMSGLDTALVNVGLETIHRELRASLAATQWITSAYLLGMAGALPASAWAARRAGSGRLWIYSLAAFTVSSGLCALSPGAGVLIVFRALQGVAGGLLVSVGMAVVADAAGRERMGRVMAVISVPTVLAPALGPTIGALLLAQLSWRWLFVLNVPIGIAALALGLRFVPRGEKTAAKRPDVAGLLLVSAGLPALIYGITAAAQYRTWTSPAAGLSLAGGIAALAAFTGRSLKRHDPLLNLRLFANRAYTAANATRFFSGISLFGSVIIMPLYFQIQRAEPIISTGLFMLAFELAAVVTFPLAGHLSDRLGSGPVITAGLVLTVAAIVPMAFLGTGASVAGVETLQAVRGIGLALAGPPGVAATMAAVDRRDLPDASAQGNIFSRVGGALGSALLVVILAGSLAPGARGAAATGAFHATFWWLTAVSILGACAAGWLAAEQRQQQARTPAKENP
jgi:EmrB/QacA subfamily drug resistance transporter